MATLFMFVYKMTTVLDKAKLVKFVHETKSIVAAQRKFRREFNRAPSHMNSIRKWVKQFSEVGDVKNKKSNRPMIPDQNVDLCCSYSNATQSTHICQKIVSSATDPEVGL